MLTYQHGLLSTTPVLKKATSPASSRFPTSPLTAKKSSESIFSAVKERVFGDHHHEKLKKMISGPSTYAPNLDMDWSIDGYEARHGLSPIPSPTIDHPRLKPEVFKAVSSVSEESDVATAMDKLDEQTG